MKFRFIAIIFTMVFVHFALAQMTVVSTNPADGAVNVDTSATISFTFSEPIDTAKVSNDPPIPFVFAIVSPSDSIELEGLSYSSDFKTVYFQVSLKPNTDYVMALTYAKSTSGNVLEHPYVLNFTTASDHGQYTVSGNVMSETESTEDVIVLLSKEPFFGEGDVDNGIVSGTVVVNSTNKMFSAQDTSNYQLNYVRPGTYYIAAGKDMNGDGIIDPGYGDMIAMYDPDDDGMEDSVVVTNQNLTGVNLKLMKFERATIKQFVDSVRQIAKQFRQDSVRLVYMQGWTDSLADGKDFGFYYVFHTPGFPYFLGIYYSVFGPDIQDSVEWVPVDTTAPEIPQNIIDSDSAMALAEQNGGATFRQKYPNWYAQFSVGNMKSYIQQAQISDTNKIVWVVHYWGANANYDVFAEHVVVMDAQTGQVYSAVTGIKDKPDTHVPQAFELRQNYPNPFNPSTVIEFTVPKAMDVQLTVYDITGRKVATLVNGRVTAGLHRVQFDAKNLAAGIYFYTLKAGNVVQTRKMVLMK